MTPSCPYCPNPATSLESRSRVRRRGSFYRKSDSRVVARFSCGACGKYFSFATIHPCYKQKKRQFNFIIKHHLCSSTSQRRIAKILNLNRKTVTRKLLFLASIAELEFEKENKDTSDVRIIEFDDLETFEHTKCKPISITLAVQSRTRRVLGIEVSRMPCKGQLAKKSLKRYGPRADERKASRGRLFQKLRPMLAPDALIKSDMNPHYVSDVKRFFPKCSHDRHRGRRGAATGQGELKKIGFDPLFSLNHTCAKLRDDVKRLARKTWCTTKKIENLRAHLILYATYHNDSLDK